MMENKKENLKNSNNEIFDDLDGGKSFVDFCRKNDIAVLVEVDGKYKLERVTEFNPNAVYMYRDGRICGLIPINGGAEQSDDGGAVTYYGLFEVREREKDIEKEKKEQKEQFLYNRVDRGDKELKWNEEKTVNRGRDVPEMER